MHDCMDLCLQEICPVEVLLPKSEEETLLFFLVMFGANDRPFLTMLALETASNGLRYTFRAGTEINSSGETIRIP